MFYKEEDMSNELICPKCTNRFDDPRILPCGNSLCQSCILDEISEGVINKCYCCQETHSLPKEGEFAKNKFIIKLLEKKPIEVKRGVLGELLKKSMIEITEKKQELETFMKSGDQIISDYLSEIRTQIDLITDNRIENLNKYRDKLLGNLKQYQLECMYTKKTNQTDFLTKLDEYNTKSKNYLNGSDWDETNINNRIKEADNLTNMCKHNIEKLEKEIFANKKPHFSPSKSIIGVETIGKLIFNNEKTVTNDSNYLNLTSLKNSKFVANTSFDYEHLSWISNLSNLNYLKAIRFFANVKSCYQLSDLKTFLMISNSTKLSEAIIYFDASTIKLTNNLNQYHNIFVLDTAFHKDYLFLKCLNIQNVNIYICRYDNGKWSNLSETYLIFDVFYKMAANDTHLYCFSNSRVLNFQYEVDRIISKEKLPFIIQSADIGSKIKVDNKFFYVLNGSLSVQNIKWVHLYNINNGILWKIVSDANFIDICLVENGLLAGLYSEKSSLLVNVYDCNKDLLIKKQLINISSEEKNAAKNQEKLEIVSFSKESQVFLDKENSTMFYNFNQ